MIVRRRDGAILRQVQTLFNIGTIGELTDGQLLERFASDTDEVAELAFSALVDRHEALVWRVCLAIVRDEHEAEDAFQATFLILVRKARSLWVRDSLGPWLHQVACRTACYLRTNAIRRHKHEQNRASMDSTRSVEVATQIDPDLHAAVHEEVDRLPEKYRAPIVLCDLEGRTHQEAARFLGWPIGTVKSRQSQGRRLIRHRLERRGLELALAGAVVESLRQSTVAAMPMRVPQSTVNAVMQQSARLLTGSGVSAHVLSLTQGVLRTMLWIRVRFLSVAALAVAIASGGASVYVSGSQEPPPYEGQPVPKLPITPPVQTSQPKISKQAEWPEPGSPQARLRAQQLATRKAKAYFDIAKSTRELAEIAKAEYEDVIYPRDLVTVEGELKLAEADLKRAAARVDWAKRMFDRRFISEAVKASEESSFKKAKFSVEQVWSKKNVLVNYTRGKTLEELRSEVENARSDELAKGAGYEQEKAKEAKMAR